MELKVDVNRCSAELDRLAQFSDVPAPAVQRVVFTPTDLAARGYLIELFEAAGLRVRVDPIGNILARWEGADPSLPALATGSHTDAIPYSGKYDGTVGVLGGLEAIRTLQQAGVKPRRSIELIMFTSEEPTRFAYGCLGSRLLSGQLAPDAAATLTDADGQRLDAVRQNAGFKGLLADVKLQPGHYAAFVELHIEQGPLLERAGLAIGAVTAIAAPAALRVRYTGPGGHAGGVMMADRRDPLIAGSRLALEVDAAARDSGSPDTVGTVGVLDVHPRAVNSIPRDVQLEIDVRDIDGPRRDRVLERIKRQAQTFGDELGVPTTIEMINADPPATSDPTIVAAIEKSCADAKLTHQRMVSRAYHDSLFMSLVCPIAMIFIPCRDGMSHRPEEYSSPEAIRAGIEVLARTLYQLAE
ncbi:M20 family metallo-hydrolase [Lacipirellula limnantheis]|uniref:Putative hydrolase n=1 Tax=Lacipirellula limnantheis TaxID=2528024 RepID=A0A517TWG3_9BACT|nr:M20 family metallo-hydrolase [Lacipirellula limnantheis]QDT72711.1 putative hydrolase [Lacipirellula limnantheis]